MWYNCQANHQFFIINKSQHVAGRGLHVAVTVVLLKKVFITLCLSIQSVQLAQGKVLNPKLVFRYLSFLLALSFYFAELLFTQNA